MPRSTRCSPRARTPIVVGGTGPLPARRADRARPAPAAGAGPARSSSSASWPRLGPAALHGRLLAGDGGRGAPERPQADRARAGAGADGRARRTRRSDQLWSEQPAPPDRAVRDHDGPRGAGARIATRVARDARRRRGRGGRAGARARARRARRARRSASRRSPRTWPARRASTRRASGSSAATAPTCKRQLTWMRKLAGVEVIDRTGARRRASTAAADRSRGSTRLPPPMTLPFQKWQALGNDYIIVERDAAPVRAHARARAADLRAALRLPLRRRAAAVAAERRALRGARCGSSTPTARRRSCRATARARRSSTCAAQGWTDSDEFSIETAAGEVRADDHLATAPAAVEMGRARLQLARLSLRRRRRPRHGDRGRPRASSSSTSASATRSA